MRFLPLPIEEAAGKILGHNITGGDGRRRLRKGRPLSAADLDVLRDLGRRTVYVAELDPQDVGEDEAARRIARRVIGGGLRRSEAKTGRVNCYAEHLGLLRLDVERLVELNMVEGVHLATHRVHAVVPEGRIAATLKIVPYALALQDVERAEALATDGGALLRLDPLPRRRTGLVLSGSPGAEERVIGGFRRALEPRLTQLGSVLEAVEFVAVDDERSERRLAACLAGMLDAGLNFLILAGETAVMDRADIAPRAINRLGGEVGCYGAPVDPGNLLLVAQIGDVPVLGAPGCARSPQANIVDLVLPRLVAGDRLSRLDIARLGVGGLLDEIHERPMPRRRAG